MAKISKRRKEFLGKYDLTKPFALNEALDIAHARELNAVAPVQWIHLLPKDRQDELARWRQATINGMRDPVLLEAAMQDLIDRADARVQARREKEKARRDARNALRPPVKRTRRRKKDMVRDLLTGRK